MTPRAGIDLKTTALKWLIGALIVAAAFAFRLAYIDVTQRWPRSLDRLFWMALRRFWSRWSEVLVIVKPEALRP